MARLIAKKKLAPWAEPSPGWDKFVEKESKILGAISSELKHKAASGKMPPNISVEELLKTLNDALTARGWSVDIAPAINADDRRGFIVSILEPAKNVQNKER